jgi:hypothetical protein
MHKFASPGQTTRSAARRPTRPRPSTKPRQSRRALPAPNPHHRPLWR